MSGFLSQAKDVMHRAGVQPYVVELNQKDDFPSGSDIQSALAAKTGACHLLWGMAFDALSSFAMSTGQRTVPNVFLGKESVGGGTDVEAFFVSGKLKDMLRAVGALE